ncbi:tyrosine recombinase [Lachnospiraceae bacterium OttesenSCG-928-D06]|nr:tyrosine recombinase [Lachnospiraceae bacterium OttesenSCG-928-D06]
MENAIDTFTIYLHTKKNASANTQASYKGDLKKLNSYLLEQAIVKIEDTQEVHLKAYISSLQEKGLKAATIARKITVIKTFYSYLYKQKIISDDISVSLKAPKFQTGIPEIMTVEETECFLEQLTGSQPKEIRDKAMMELIYATGIRVSELVSLKLTDTNLNLGFVICKSDNRERLIPFGNQAKEALDRYLKKAREILLRNGQSDYLFLNCFGKPMSRQGFWKLVKYYGNKAGIEKVITPYTLRHSFTAHLVENGADIEVVNEMLGNAESKTSAILDINSSQKLKAVYTKYHPRH